MTKLSPVVKAEHRLQDAQLAVAEARMTLTEATRKVKGSRAKFADALQRWLAVAPPISPEQARKDHLAAEKRRAAEAEPPHPARHMSQLDAVMSAGKSRSVNFGTKRPNYPARLS